jgi:hypothetical protein
LRQPMLLCKSCNYAFFVFVYPANQVICYTHV